MSDFHFENIFSQQQAANISIILTQEIVQTFSKGDSYKSMITKILNNMQNNLNSDSPVQSKVATLFVLRDFTQNLNNKQLKFTKFFSVLLAHDLLKDLEKTAENIDPFKPISEKGKTYFPLNSAKGNDFIRLILQLIKYWAGKFPTSSSEKKPTYFKKIVDKLNEKKVIMPQNYKFVNAKKEQQQGKVNKSYQKQQKVQKYQNRQSTPGSNIRGTAGVKAQIKFQYDKILNFLQILQVQQEGQIVNQIMKTHENLSRQKSKFDKMANEVNSLQDKDQQSVSQFITIQQFISNQAQIYSRHIDTTRDFQSYIFKIKQLGQNLFPEAAQQKPKNNLGSMMKKDSKLNSSKPPQKQQKKQAFDPTLLNKVGQYFMKIQQRSKSPLTTSTFKKINVSKQKSGISGSKVKRSYSPINVPKAMGKSTNSLKQSKLSPIFLNPPNPNPPYRNYEGKQVEQNIQLGACLASISKNQGLRRFKTANFKGKSSLFQNQDIQIGYKSETIYQQVQNFKILIKIQLFIGNLGEQTIRNFSLQFKGNQNILLYSNPRVISDSILKGEQNKIQLIIVPLKPDYPLLAMKMKYMVLGDAKYQSIILPNSILKLVNFLQISKNQFKNRWSNIQLYKTTQFKLCHYLPPDTFTKWMPSLSQNTSYSNFIINQSKNDYQVICSLIMMQKYQGLLKIIVRPNLNVVVQLGIEDQNQQAKTYFTVFLQSFQQFLKQINSRQK